MKGSVAERAMRMQQPGMIGALSNTRRCTDHDGNRAVAHWTVIDDAHSQE